MCGLPDGCMSPSDRSTIFGISIFAAYSDASKNPGEPGWIFAFPDCVSSSGSQPASRSAPVQITRSAERTRAMRLGRGWIRCGFCRAVVPVYTETGSPASSCASAPHSGSQAKTLSAAMAGNATMAEPDAPRILRIVFMSITSEFVGAMRTQTHDVLEQDLIVGYSETRLVARELQPDAAELARVPIGHQRMALRGVVSQDRKISGREHARVDRAKARGARIQAIAAVADAPLRDKLIHALQVPARLPRGEAAGLRPERRGRGVVSETAVLAAPEVLCLQLEAGIGVVPVRRPFQDPIQHPEAAPATEAVADDRPGRVQIIVAAVLGRGAQIGKSRLPCGTRAYVSAGVSEQVARTEAVLVAPAIRSAGKLPPASEFESHVEIQLGRRHPPQLNAVLRKPVAEKYLAGERRVGKIPGMCVNLVLIAHSGKKAARLERKPVGKGQRLNIALLDCRAIVFWRYRRDQRSPEVVVDVGGEREFRFSQAQAARWRPDLAQRRDEAVDPEPVRILRQVRVDTVQDQRNPPVHCVFPRGPVGGVDRCLVRRGLGFTRRRAGVACRGLGPDRGVFGLL